MNLPLDEYRENFKEINQQFSRAVFGQERILRKILIGMLCRGHVLLEGVPGVAKTLMVKTLAQVSGCQFSRVQFTPDLLPGDITGVESYDSIKKFYVIKGPIFANFVLADEINRASPKVQSALLEAMQERQVTIGKETFSLPDPFMVIATQNPIESVGVYNLPEAQVDRFLFKLRVTYPSLDEEENILQRNMTMYDFKSFNIQPVLSEEKIHALQKTVLDIYSNDHIRRYIVSIIDATRHPQNYSLTHAKYIGYGASPRASIGIYMAAKAHAMVNGRDYVTPQDVKEMAADVLRHRIFMGYEAQVEGVSSDDIVEEILKKVPVP